MILRRLLHPFLHCSRGLSASLAVLIIALIHLLSFLPRAPSIAPRHGLGPVFSNWLHFPLYAGLCLWILLAMSRPPGELPRGRAPFAWTFALVLLAGISDEWHQLYAPWRHGDPIDLVTDAISAAGLLWILFGLQEGRSERSLWARFVLIVAATLASASWAYLAAC